MKSFLLIFASMLILPCIVFSQHTDNKDSGNKTKSKIVVVKKPIKTQSVNLSRYTYKYSSEYRIDNGVPDDFPKYIDTGNHKIDAANYYNAKQQWIRNNPEGFEKIKHLAL